MSRQPRRPTGQVPKRRATGKVQQQRRPTGELRKQNQQAQSLQEFHEKYGKKMWRFGKLVIFLLVIYICILVFRSYDFIIVPLYNSQMEPTVNPSERYVGKTVDYDDLEHGDIVYYEFPYRTLRNQEEPFFMARVVGLEGDRVGLRDGYVYRNGEVIQELYTTKEHLGKENFPDILIPKNHVYLLIDKRFPLEKGIQYRDSRHWGPIFKYAIKGILRK